MSTVDEIKMAAGRLTPDELYDLWSWLGSSVGLREKRVEQLQKEIRLGLDDFANGAVVELNMAEIKRKARESIRRECE